MRRMISGRLDPKPSLSLRVSKYLINFGDSPTSTVTVVSVLRGLAIAASYQFVRVSTRFLPGFNPGFNRGKTCSNSLGNGHASGLPVVVRMHGSGVTTVGSSGRGPVSFLLSF